MYEIEPAFLCLDEVMVRVKLGKTAIYKRMNAGVFPRPVVLGERCVRWRVKDIDLWIASPLPLPNQSRDEGVSA